MRSLLYKLFDLLNRKRDISKLVNVPEIWLYDDLAKIRKDDKGLFKDNFKVILVNNLKDVFKVALVDFDSSVLSPNV